MIEIPTVRLNNSENLTYSAFLEEINNGGRLVIYQYCISTVLLTFRRFTKIHLIREGQSRKQYRWKADIVTWLFGWWGIPYGPIYSPQSLKINRLGGIDVTDDVLINIDEDSFNDGVVTIAETRIIFGRIDKWDKKAVISSTRDLFNRNPGFKALYVGKPLINEEDKLPYLTLGIEANSNYENLKDQITQKISKKFRKGTLIQFIDLNDNSDLSAYLIEQGIKIY